ncbi:sensor histidine kinase [Haloarcula amylovorans]|uniref:sensor histidine kinase n=1 Tax=Haloarcula amylovorans TaxID=2562280 RepID=UPI0010766674|nr:HAMP domain-containing sensor histidine kinase [Halomicroarcula amylolytica]
MVLCSGIAAEFAYRLYGSPPMTSVFLVGVATSLPFTLVIVSAGYGLPKLTVSERYYPRIGAWALVGGVFLGTILSAFGPLLFDDVLSQVGLLRWGLSVGVGSGFLAGCFNARVIEGRVAAERAQVRAEEAEDRQEILEYLNALLRHEVLNAATVVYGQANLIEAGLDSESPHHVRLGNIERQADDLAAVVKDVQLLIRANETQDTIEPIDLCTVISTEVEKLAVRSDDLVTELDLPESAVVMADSLVNRLFSNLFRNAVEHAETTPVTLTITATVDEANVRVRIRDNGPGVPESLRDHLFDPTMDRHDTEIRLGTVIVGRLVDRYDGEIELSRTGPKGTTIAVRLPLVEESGSSDTQTAVEPSGR